MYPQITGAYTLTEILYLFDIWAFITPFPLVLLYLAFEFKCMYEAV